MCCHLHNPFLVPAISRIQIIEYLKNEHTLGIPRILGILVTIAIDTPITRVELDNQSQTSWSLQAFTFAKQ
jgi:hypothetical protein